MNLGKRFVVLLVLIAIQNSCANSGALYLYQGSNFERLIGKFPVTASCSIIPTVVAQNVNSLRTNECIILFESTNCAVSASSISSVYGSLKISPGEYNNKNEIPGIGDLTRGYFQSYRKCNSTYGGSNTRVTLYDRYKKVIVDYEDVCQFTEVPTFANYPQKIDNHGNCIKVEIGNNRNSSTSTEIFYGGAQRKSLFFNPSSGTSTFKLVSISPCFISASCETLKATITEFYIEDPSPNHGIKLLDLSIGDNRVFINEGLATVSQNYKAYLNTTLVTNTGLPANSSVIGRWEIQDGIDYRFSSDIPINAHQAVITSLSAAFISLDGDPQPRNQTNLHQVWNEYQVDEEIQIAACTKYQITSFVRMAKQFPMKYTVTYEVTGTSAEERPLLANEIQSKLGTLFYKFKNELTAIATDVGTILVDFGLETVVHGKAEKIPGCVSNQL